MLWQPYRYFPSVFSQVARLSEQNSARKVQHTAACAWQSECECSLTSVMMPRWWLALRPWCFGVECPLLGGEEEDARDWAVAEVGKARGRSVTLRPSMLPLFTRDSMSPDRKSADSLSTWIILRIHIRHNQSTTSVGGAACTDEDLGNYTLWEEGLECKDFYKPFCTLQTTW